MVVESVCNGDREGQRASSTKLGLSVLRIGEVVRRGWKETGTGTETGTGRPISGEVGTLD